jgi:Zn-finger nucleic acid-binding protein
MEDRAAGDAVVDVCSECHAVWIDWFDGDIATVAGEVDVVKTIPARISDKHPCPRCRTELVSERLYQTGPFVYRCKDCSGVLVPSAALSDVVALGPSDRRGDTDDDGPFARMIAKLRKVLGAASA